MAGDSFFEKNAHGWSFIGLPCCWESTTPILISDASTSTMNKREGSGWWNTHDPLFEFAEDLIGILCPFECLGLPERRHLSELNLF